MADGKPTADQPQWQRFARTLGELIDEFDAIETEPFSNDRLAVLACLLALDDALRKARGSIARPATGLPGPLYRLMHESPHSDLRKIVRITSAAFLQYWKDTGVALEPAAKEIARALDDVGYRKPGEKTDPYTTESIIDWRKDFKEAELFKRQLAEFYECESSVRWRRPDLSDRDMRAHMTRHFSREIRIFIATSK